MRPSTNAESLRPVRMTGASADARQRTRTLTRGRRFMGGRKRDEEDAPFRAIGRFFALKEPEERPLAPGFALFFGAVKVPEDGAAFVAGFGVVLFAVEGIDR